MALSRIWSFFVIIALLVAGFKFFSGTGEKEIFTSMVIGKSGDSLKVSETNISMADGNIIKALDTVSRVKRGNVIYKKVDESIVSVKLQKANGIIETCKDAVNISIGLIGIMTLFMGFMSIAEKAGGINLLSRIIGPFFSKLFPGVPKGHPAHGHMMMNFSANLLGLDNAATPFGIKAMESLQELNPEKEVASNAQIMFLCLHAAGFNIIPVSVIAIRASTGASDPTDVFLPCMIVTFVGTMVAMLIVSLRQKINLLQPVILLWIAGISAVVALLVWYITTLSSAGVQSFSGILSNGLILLVFLLIVL